MSVTLSWDESDFGDCEDGATVSKVMLRAERDDDTYPSPPSATDPTDGELVAVLALGVETFKDEPLRSDYAHTYRIYACTGTTAPECGTQSSPTICDAADIDTPTIEADTEQQVFVFPNITALTDTSHRVADVAHSPAPLQYPSGNYDDQVGIYYTSGDGAEDRGVYFVRNTATTWSGGVQDMNDTADWTTPEVIMEYTNDEDHGTPGSHGHVGEPWVVVIDDDGTHRIRLGWVNNLQEDESGDREVQYADSDDMDGDQDSFGFCTTTSCSTAGCDNTEGSETCCCYDEQGSVVTGALGAYEGAGECLDGGLHGRVAWDYINDPTWDPDAQDTFYMAPSRVNASFTSPTNCSTCTSTTNQDDTYRADWDTSNGDLDINKTGVCPDVYIENEYAPTFVPLPGGEYAVYTLDKTGTNDGLRLRYTDDEALSFDKADGTEALLYLDDTTTPGTPGNSLDADCIGDPAMLQWVDDGPPVTRRTLLFAIALTDSGCFTSASDDGLISGFYYNP